MNLCNLSFIQDDCGINYQFGANRDESSVEPAANPEQGLFNPNRRSTNVLLSKALDPNLALGAYVQN